MDKPIIEGCRAVIVNSEVGSNGIVVTVGKFLGKSRVTDGVKYSYGERWEIDCSITCTLGNLHKSIAQYHLKRIDDDEAPSWEAIESITKWNPNKEKVNG